MAEMLEIDNMPYSVIGGTTAYIEMDITVPLKTVSLTGEVTVERAPVPYSDATITAVAYAPGCDAESATVEDIGNNRILIKIPSGSTAKISQKRGTTNALLEVSAVLKLDIPNSRYKTGDKLGYRWGFFVEADLVA